jgi:hypothetical protein
MFSLGSNTAARCIRPRRHRIETQSADSFAFLASAPLQTAGASAFHHKSGPRRRTCQKRFCCEVRIQNIGTRFCLDKELYLQVFGEFRLFKKTSKVDFATEPLSFCYPSYGLLTFAPVSLILTEHASLCWTRPIPRICNAAHIRGAWANSHFHAHAVLDNSAGPALPDSGLLWYGSGSHRTTSCCPECSAHLERFVRELPQPLLAPKEGWNQQATTV